MKVKVGRNKTSKHNGVVFACLNTRAIHCELAVDASAMELMQVLRRFFLVSRLSQSHPFGQWHSNGRS